MSKATHKGTCQCCGNVQKLPSGVLSKHGYTVDFGWFNGVCMGAGHLPFEKSTDLIERCIESAKQSIERLTAEIAELKTATDYVWLHIYVGARTRNGSAYRWTKYNRADIRVETYGDEGQFEKYHVEFEAYGYNGPRTKKHEVGSYTTNTLNEAITKSNESYAKTLQRQVEQAEKYIAWQQKRIEGWVEADLIEL